MREGEYWREPRWALLRTGTGGKLVMSVAGPELPVLFVRRGAAREYAKDITGVRVVPVEVVVGV